MKICLKLGHPRYSRDSEVPLDGLQIALAQLVGHVGRWGGGGEAQASLRSPRAAGPGPAPYPASAPALPTLPAGDLVAPEPKPVGPVCRATGTEGRRLQKDARPARCWPALSAARVCAAHPPELMTCSPGLLVPLLGLGLGLALSLAGAVSADCGSFAPAEHLAFTPAARTRWLAPRGRAPGPLDSLYGTVRRFLSVVQLNPFPSGECPPPPVSTSAGTGPPASLCAHPVNKHLTR